MVSVLCSSRNEWRHRLFFFPPTLLLFVAVVVGPALFSRHLSPFADPRHVTFVGFFFCGLWGTVPLVYMPITRTKYKVLGSIVLYKLPHVCGHADRRRSGTAWDGSVLMLGFCSYSHQMTCSARSVPKKKTIAPLISDLKINPGVDDVRAVSEYCSIHQLCSCS